jgi:cytidine deaminase
MSRKVNPSDLTTKEKSLLLAANYILRNSQNEYSGFAVACALIAVDDDGKEETILGINVENVSSPVTICAERVAIGNMATKGYKKILMMAVIAKPSVGVRKNIISPCGMCRQAIIKYGNKIPVIMANTAMDQIEIWDIDELLPLSFSEDSLKK